MRNLTKTLAIVSLLVPASAYPLGVGEITLHSALNQNLSAEIALVLAPGEKAADIKVNLAPPDKFDQTGVPWTYFLSKLKFQTIASPNGAIVKITSNEELKEPFLDFLLEVTWPKGSLYREFTVLVDPPDVYQQAVVPVITPIESEQSLQTTQTTELPIRRRTPSASKPKAPKVQRIQAPVVVSVGQYGPTVKNDTLWRVAERVSSSSGVSVEQTMIGLYQANPQAFYKQNINALMAGKRLNIPERNALLKLTRQQALDEFDRQNKAWRNRSVEPIPSVVVEESPTENQLTLEAPKQDTVRESTAAASIDIGNPTTNKTLTEKTADNAAATTAQTLAEPSRTQQAPNAGTPSSSDEEIKSKIAALEKQLAVMQDIITLKDQQLATLQGQPPKTPAVTEPQKPAPTVEKKVEPPVASVKTEEVKPVVKPVVVPRPAPAPVVEQEPETDWVYLFAGGTGFGLLGYIAWVMWRRKNQNQFDIESMYGYADVDSASKPITNNVFEGSILEEVSVDSLDNGDNLFSSDLTSNDFDMFDMEQGEIDPISEADVYLAYGRYQQAEELMRHAIQDQPARDDFKLKLLEIYYANEKNQEFDRYANELFDMGKNSDNVFWAKVVEMGSEICPDSVLFSGQNGRVEFRKKPTVEDGKPAASNSDQLLDEMDFNLASFEELFGGSTLGSEKENPVSLSKPNDDLFTPDLLGAVEEPKANNEAIDFDFDLFASEPENEPKTPKTETKSDSTLETVEFASPSPSPSKDLADPFFDISSFGTSNLADMDEMETKLDLAIAYVDMGDNEAAKGIAAEVLKNGNKEQQMVAKSLLDSLLL